MANVTFIADKAPSGRGISFAGLMASVVAALALASGGAAWIGNFDPVAWVSNPASPKDGLTSSFDDRFSVAVASELELKFQQAKGRLVRKLQSQSWRAALLQEPNIHEPTIQEPNIQEPAIQEPTIEKPPLEKPAPSSVAAVPLPKSRPVEANLELKNAAPNTQQAENGVSPAQPDNRSLLQKLSDLLPARVTLASLAPDGGLFHERPNLASLGYDNVTAVYDISARAVYMPDGSTLEAHSGFGSLMDDPGHVSERNVGATPPNVYDLKPREKIFHGVQALRLIPVDDNSTLGRSGLLAHSYMLGPKGDSNGCVSIKDYDKFLKAYSNGEIRRLVVVPNLSDPLSASRRSTSQS